MKVIQLEAKKIDEAITLLNENGFECSTVKIDNLSETDKLIAEKKLEFQVAQLEQQISELDNLYQQLTKRVRGFIKMDIPSGKMTLIDKFLAELSGYSITEWKKIPNFISSIVHPDFREYYMRFYNEMESGIVSKLMDYKIIKKDGAERWWLQFNIGAYNIEGKLVSISSVIIDNTEYKETEIKYSNLFENLNAGVFRTDIETGEILEANLKLALAAGYSSVKELKEKSKVFDFYLNLEDRKHIIEVLKTQGKITDYEVQLKRRDGSTVWGSHSASYYPKEGNCDGIIIDITNRKNTERKLVQSEDKFRSLIEQSVAGIMIIKDCKVIFANDVIIKHSGYTHTEISSMELAHLRNIIHPEDVDNVMEQFKIVEEEGEVPEFYCRIITQDKRTIWVSTQLKKFSSEDSSAIALIIVEVTKRAELEQKLLKERNIAQKYFEMAGALLVVLDRNANIVQINKRGCEIFGYTKNELIGKNWIDYCLPERVKAGVRDTFNKAINGEISAEDYFENYILTKDYDERLISWHNSIIKNDEGVVEATICSGEDITQWRLAEEFLQKNNDLKKA
ncbi:MAG: PAS domain S-box protein [Candidatus Heimdallarchaeota archaeon]